MNHSTEEIVPYIREVGLQKRDSWKNLYRRIYDHQFLYCFCGIIHIQIEERNYEVKQGDLVIIKPNVPHKGSFIGFIVICFHTRIRNGTIHFIIPLKHT